MRVAADGAPRGKACILAAHFYFSMLHLAFSRFWRLAPALLAAPLLALTALAQAPAGPAYTGPRYPGGPDSLRAAVRRELRTASPAWIAPIFVRLELSDAGAPLKGTFLVPPPGTPAATLVRNREVQALTEQLVQRQPHWQPAAAAATPTAKRLAMPTLLLPFGLPPEAVPLPYSDELPTFPIPGGQTGNTLSSVIAYVQRNVRYPAEDLRAGRQGTVYAYFEVSETGVIEHPQIVGSLSSSLDAEVLRLVKQLPAARTAPYQQGRPVRVYYVLPFDFRIM